VLEAIKGKSAGGEYVMPELLKRGSDPVSRLRKGLIAWSVFIVALLLMLCGSLKGSNEIADGNTSGPATFTGEISKGLKIEMRLHRDGSNLHGVYLYELFGREIELRGTIDEHGEIALQEFVKGKVTGNFDGRFVSKDRIEGRWYKKSGDKGRSFYLVGTSAPLGAAQVMAGSKPAREDREVAPAAKETRSAQKTEAAVKPAPMAAEARPPKQSNASQAIRPAMKEAAAQPLAARPEAKAQYAERVPAAQQLPQKEVQQPLPKVAEQLPQKAVQQPLANAAQQPAPKIEPMRIETTQAPAAGQMALRPAVEEDSPEPIMKSEARPEEKGPVVGKSIQPVHKKGFKLWALLSELLNMKVGGAIGGILLLGGGLAWLAVVAGGAAAFRENSALFRQVHAMGISFLPGIVLLALGVGAVLAVFVE
jgi:hypothetical protein